MKDSAALLIKLSICMMLLSSCAVGMAASGKKNLDTSILFPGAPRSAVILKLGAPETSTVDEEGNYVESYLIIEGNEPSSERAIVHGVMDVVTLGLWEVVGTPIELAAGSESSSRVVIHYDSNQKIRDIQFVDGEIVEESTGKIDSNETAEQIGGNKTGGIINQNN